jgi:predicted nucleic acid-binding protein
MLQRAWHWCDAAKISFWDALILAGAELSGCPYLLSEDFQAGRIFGAVTIVNPFHQGPPNPHLNPV